MSVIKLRVVALIVVAPALGLLLRIGFVAPVPCVMKLFRGIQMMN
jgi:hypothetical protein